METPSYDVIEGMTSISAVLRTLSEGRSSRKIMKILYNSDKGSSKYDTLRFLSYRAEEFGFSLEAVDAATIDELSHGKTHGGFLALCTPRELPELSPDALPSDGFFAIAEGLEDPYNYAYALRSLYAAGADGIVVSDDRLLTSGGDIARSSAGASELLRVYRASAEDAIPIFRTKGYKIVCAGIRDAVSLYDADLKRPLLLIVGGEKRGISRAVLSMADEIVRIDYGRSFTGSLPASSAATILAFEILRQNR